MKVLIVGSGGREHALAWQVSKSSKVKQVFVAPGNAGTATEQKVQNVEIKAEDIQGLCEFAKKSAIDLTIVGPEVPLTLGIVDLFNKAGLKCFGPSQGAAQLEESKAFSKAFMKQYNIPTAAYEIFTELEPALAYVEKQSFPLVIKASGLAAGKGVVIAQSRDEAQTAVIEMMSDKRFGHAGEEVVIEAFLQGTEASFIVMCDGEYALPMATSKDHKARDEGGKGPNTGGMGAFSPATTVTEIMHEKVMRDVIRPVLKGMKDQGTPYIGFLYAGLMISSQGEISVLEFNCRFGDPETQPIMMRLKSDLAQLCLSALEGALASQEIKWDSRPALGVVMASRGYPESYPKGETIVGLNEFIPTDVKIFHAGTRVLGSDVVTSGGRVLCVTTLGENLSEARDKVYSLVKNINWDSTYYRKDIGAYIS